MNRSVECRLAATRIEGRRAGSLSCCRARATAQLIHRLSSGASRSYSMAGRSNKSGGTSRVICKDDDDIGVGARQQATAVLDAEVDAERLLVPAKSLGTLASRLWQSVVSTQSG